MISSRRSSAVVWGSLRMPRSSMMSRGTRVSSSRRALRVSARVASASSSRKVWRFAVEDAVALLDCGAADGLGNVALARTGRAEKQSVFALGDEAGGGELEDERAVDFLVEGEVEAVEGAVGVAESGLLVAPGRAAGPGAGGARRRRGRRRGRWGPSARPGPAAGACRGHRPCRRGGACGGPGRVRRDS